MALPESTGGAEGLTPQKGNSGMRLLMSLTNVGAEALRKVVNITDDSRFGRMQAGESALPACIQGCE